MSDKKSKETEKMEKQIDAFENDIKAINKERNNEAPVQETEPQTKLSQKEISNSKDIYLKPDRRISDPAKFNEEYRKDWEFAKEYVQFVAEHKEIIGEAIEIWTRPFGGVGAEFWKVPVNKPVWGPRYLAEQIRRKTYNRMKMDENRIYSQDGSATFYGSMVSDTKIARLTAEPVSSKKSVFMGKAA